MSESAARLSRAGSPPSSGNLASRHTALASKGSWQQLHRQSNKESSEWDLRFFGSNAQRKKGKIILDRSQTEITRDTSLDHRRIKHGAGASPAQY
mmetsp:Transcript_53170/g.105451  ORF Transcript_53170/g.105451 Transcript_53170/m.105451 type:complete len:95 (+) Transcript_53170:734-1018(+)